jgi:Flp pilus assembly protein TadG
MYASPNNLGRTDRRRAAAIVEMAILLPFLALMFLVAVDFCRVFHTSQTIEGCAETAVLYACGAAQPPTGSDPISAAKAAAVADSAVLNPPLDPNRIAITVSGSVASVSVSYDFAPLVHYPGLPEILTITRTAQTSVFPQVGQR